MSITLLWNTILPPVYYQYAMRLCWKHFATCSKFPVKDCLQTACSLLLLSFSSWHCAACIPCVSLLWLLSKVIIYTETGKQVFLHLLRHESQSPIPAHLCEWGRVEGGGKVPAGSKSLVLYILLAPNHETHNMWEVTNPFVNHIVSIYIFTYCKILLASVYWIFISAWWLRKWDMLDFMFNIVIK